MVVARCDMDWDTLLDWLHTPWLTIGKSPITAANVLGLVVILVAVWWFSVVIERGLRRVALHGRSTDADSTVYAFTRLVRYVVWIIGTLVGLTYIGFDLTNLAFLGGAIGVGIGFGLQNIFSNFISGIIILIEKTLKVGDFVDLESGVRGTVTEIAMRYTRVTTNDSVDVLVPNSEFINGRVTNWTFGERYRRIRVGFGVAYGTDKTQVRDAALAAARETPGIVIDAAHPATARLINFGDSSLDFEMIAWVGPEAIGHPGRTKADFLWALETELARRNIEIPFPQRDLHVRSGIVRMQMDPAPSSPGVGEEAGGAARQP